MDSTSLWARRNGFSFSHSKTVMVKFFFKLEPPKVNLNGANVPVIETTEFIGFTWDSKLSLVPHINKLMDSCMKSSNLLRSVSSYHIDIVENERIVTQGQPVSENLCVE